MGPVQSADEWARLARDVVVSLETSNLGLGCRVATPFVSLCSGAGPVYTQCDLDGAPPSLTAHYSRPLSQPGVRLFSTADPPEVACDIMLLSAAPPTREAWLLTTGEVALLTWKFSAERGLLEVHCDATVQVLPPDEHDLGLYQMQALSTVPGVVLQGMVASPAAETFLRSDVRALMLLDAATKAGVELSVAARYLLYHVGVAAQHDLVIVQALTYLSPAVLTALRPRIEEAGLRPRLEDAFVRLLEQPRSWLEPLLVERVAVFSSANLDQRVLDLLAGLSSPWIAWWLMAQAMEAIGNLPTASKLGCGALDKLPTSQKTIELLERCGQPDGPPAVAMAVAWMRLQKWHRAHYAEDVLNRMCSATEAERLIEESTAVLEQGTQSSSRLQSRH